MIRGLVSLCVLLATLSHADESTDAAKRKQVKELRDLGVEASERGDYLIALEKFEQAYALNPSAALMFNRARVQADLGRDLEALENFERFVAEAKDPPAQFASVAKAKIAVLSQRIARLEIVCDTASANVAVDGRPIGTAPLHTTIRVLPGSHEVSARAAGYSPAVSAVIAQPGRQDRINLALSSPPVAKPLYKKWWFWTAVVGAATVATAIGVGVAYGRHDPPSGDQSAIIKTESGTALRMTP